MTYHGVIRKPTVSKRNHATGRWPVSIVGRGKTNTHAINHKTNVEATKVQAPIWPRTPIPGDRSTRDCGPSITANNASTNARSRTKTMLPAPIAKARRTQRFASFVWAGVSMGWCVRIMRCRIAGRLTSQFSGGAMPLVPWHFIHDRPLQLLVRRRAPGQGKTTRHQRTPSLTAPQSPGRQFLLAPVPDTPYPLRRAGTARSRSSRAGRFPAPRDG